ncbi:DUF6241 domain-containing protein [Bacillota bacterium Lsc_1132]
MLPLPSPQRMFIFGASINLTLSSSFLVDKNGNQAANTTPAGTSKISGAKADLQINDQPAEEDVIQTMHEMTHQKIKADEKWGAVPLTQNTANEGVLFFCKIPQLDAFLFVLHAKIV